MSKRAAKGKASSEKERKGVTDGYKEILYICTMPPEETADYICALPYTLIESIIEAALSIENTETMYEIFAARVTLLRYTYISDTNAKKALRKLLRVCQVLGCISYFDFGDWEAFRDEENNSGALTAHEILFVKYPAFRVHFPILKEKGIIEEIGTGLKWNRDKTAAAEYFDSLECTERNRRWKVVEDVFGFKDLRIILNNHRGKQGKEKHTRDFDEIKKLLNLE